MAVMLYGLGGSVYEELPARQGAKNRGEFYAYLTCN